MHAIAKQLLHSISNPHTEQATDALAGNQAGTIHIVKHQNIHLPKLPVVTVQALCGVVWITRDGDPDDIVLEAGQAVDLQQVEDVLISGLSNAYIRLRPAYPFQGQARTVPLIDSKIRREALARPCSAIS